MDLFGSQVNTEGTVERLERSWMMVLKAETQSSSRWSRRDRVYYT